MKREDLIIGQKYQTSTMPTVVISVLEAIDKGGAPVLRSIAPCRFVKYDRMDEKVDPSHKIGTYGHTMSYFLDSYKPYKE